MGELYISVTKSLKILIFILSTFDPWYMSSAPENVAEGVLVCERDSVPIGILASVALILVGFCCWSCEPLT